MDSHSSETKGMKKKDCRKPMGMCSGSSSWLMMLGCLAPIILLLILPFFGVQKASLAWLAVLACPLAMLFMYRMQTKSQKGVE